VKSSRSYPRSHSRHRPALEVLEDRMMPAVLVNPTTLTYQDVDGDTVTVTVTRGTLDQTNFTFDGAFADSGPQQLRLVDLRGAEFQGSDLSITAVRSATNGGDGFVNVGRIDGSGVDLGAVVVDGDLGAIDAGDATTATPGLASLTVQSLGRLGISTGAADLQSDIVGKLGVLLVKSDLLGTVRVTGGQDGKIGSVKVGGSLLGGALTSSGSIQAEGNTGAVIVKGSVIGGDGDFSGRIASEGKIGGTVNGLPLGVRIGGSLLGGAGTSSGVVFAHGTLGPVTIGHNLQGGAGTAPA